MNKLERNYLIIKRFRPEPCVLPETYDLYCDMLWRYPSVVERIENDYKHYINVKDLIPKCCVCGSTENLTYGGSWYEYRCDSPNCTVY